MANNKTPKFVRVPKSESPNKVFMTGERGGPIADPEDLMKATGAETKEKAFEQVKDIGPDEARSMGVRLPGTPRIYGEQTETLTPEMLENIPARETTPAEIEGGQRAAEPEETLGGGLDEARNTISDADDTIQDIGKRIQQLEKQIGEYASSQKEVAQEERKTTISKLKEIATGTTRSEKREELESEAKLQKEKKELQNIQNKIQKRKALLQKEISSSEGRLEPMGFIRGEKAQMKAQAQADISLLQVEAELEQGDVEMAQQKIQRGLEDFEATKQRQTQFYNTLFNLHNQDVMRFENKELKALRQQKNAVINAYTRKQNEMTNKWKAQSSVLEAGGEPIKNIESKSLQEVRQEVAEKLNIAYDVSTSTSAGGGNITVTTSDGTQKTVDATSTQGLSSLKELGVSRTDARAKLDQSDTGLTQNTIETMLNDVYGEKFSFNKDEKKELRRADMTDSEIQSLSNDIDQYGDNTLDDSWREKQGLGKTGLSEQQKTAVRKVRTGSAMPQDFLTKDFIETSVGSDVITSAAEGEGSGTEVEPSGFWDTDKNKRQLYLKQIMGYKTKLEEQGFSEEQVWNVIKNKIGNDSGIELE